MAATHEIERLAAEQKTKCQELLIKNFMNACVHGVVHGDSSVSMDFYERTGERLSSDTFKGVSMCQKALDLTDLINAKKHLSKSGMSVSLTRSRETTDLTKHTLKWIPGSSSPRKQQDKDAEVRREIVEFSASGFLLGGVLGVLLGAHLQQHYSRRR